MEEFMSQPIIGIHFKAQLRKERHLKKEYNCLYSEK
jgi:hypothetical protein